MASGIDDVLHIKIADTVGIDNGAVRSLIVFAVSNGGSANALVAAERVHSIVIRILVGVNIGILSAAIGAAIGGASSHPFAVAAVGLRIVRSVLPHTIGATEGGRIAPIFDAAAHLGGASGGEGATRIVREGVVGATRLGPLGVINVIIIANSAAVRRGIISVVVAGWERLRHGGRRGNGRPRASLLGLAALLQPPLPSDGPPVGGARAGLDGPVRTDIGPPLHLCASEQNEGVVTCLLRRGERGGRRGVGGGRGGGGRGCDLLTLALVIGMASVEEAPRGSTGAGGRALASVGAGDGRGLTGAEGGAAQDINR